MPLATAAPASSRCGRFAGNFYHLVPKEKPVSGTSYVNCGMSGNISKSFCWGYLVRVSLWEESGRSGIAQHKEPCSSEVRESGRIAQDRSRLLPVIRGRVNHSLTVMVNTSFFTTSSARLTVLCEKYMASAPEYTKIACPGAGTRKLHFPVPTKALLFAPSPSLLIQTFLLLYLHFCFLRDVHASKVEWTVPSSLMRWSEHPVDMINIL